MLLFLAVPLCCFAPLSCPHVDVVLQAFAVEPGLATVDVAHIEEIAVWGVFRSTVTTDDEDVVLGRKGDGDGVMECGWRGICSSVDRIDGHA